jgi:hypothetical protein
MLTAVCQFYSPAASPQQHERMQSATKQRLAAVQTLFTHAVQFTDLSSAFEIILPECRATSCLYRKAGSYKAIEHALVHLRQHPTLTLKVSIARFDTSPVIGSGGF